MYYKSREIQDSRDPGRDEGKTVENGLARMFYWPKTNVNLSVVFCKANVVSW